MASVTAWNDGSKWVRWEPHIHTPETAANDGYGAKEWAAYLTAIENAMPRVVALGVTDYFTLGGYKKLLKHRDAGRLPAVEFVFPNVELRLDIRTEKAGGGVNIHLLFNPDMPDAVGQIEGLLSLLTFERSGDRVYKCTDDDLVRLGRALRGDAQLEASAALREGVKQFKVGFEKLRDAIRTNTWTERNCIVAVANGEDGLGGLREDGFGEVRNKLAYFADIIFSGSPNDRAFWLGKKAFDEKAIETTFRTLKACLHGSDAHTLEDVCRPAQDRYCWLKARPSWHGLRQVLAEPEERVFVANAPPLRPRRNSVGALRATANWFPSGPLNLNEGIVTIIGPRGSGKTALADLLAFGADAYEPSGASFLVKAGEHAHGTTVSIDWTDGRDVGERVVRADSLNAKPNPSLCYLSQQFVEHLCSTEGEQDRLIEQIERVVFDRLSPVVRGDASSFAEVRELEMADIAFEVRENRRTISELTVEISEEVKLERSVPVLKEKLAKLDAEIVGLEKQLGATAVKGKEEKVKRFQESCTLFAAAEKRMQGLQGTKRTLGNLRRELVQLEARADLEFAARRQKLLEVGLEETQLAQFRQSFPKPASATLQAREHTLDEAIAAELGAENAPSAPGTFGALALIHAALQKELATDSTKEKQLVELAKALSLKRTDRDKLAKHVKHAIAASSRTKALQGRRQGLYLRVLELIGDEERTLERLYEPLLTSLGPDGPKGGEVDFYIRRNVDVDVWAARGEELLDLRRRGPFSQIGALKTWAVENLGPVWHGKPGADARVVLAGLMKELGDVREALKPTTTLPTFAEWLFSSAHIRVTYGIRYEKTEIERLSPGTRGIVLLILFLALDTSDDRPLVVDQPEENLDPKSVFSELCGYFRRARERRQVIVVTHNANLVVNTDADQVIVASSARLPGQQLPAFSYRAGALEDEAIRSEVCELLEGGEAAFKRRERRYEFARG